MSDIESFISDLLSSFEQPFSVIIVRVLAAVIVVIVGRWVAKRLAAAARRGMERADVDKTLISFFDKAAYYLLLLVVIVIALGIMGIPTSSLVAVLGAGTLAIGLALQDSIANIASGISIISLKPFVVGDYLKVGGEEGFVQEVRFYHTLLTTRDNKVVFIPNKEVMNSNITNFSMTKLIRLDLVFGISYTDDVHKAKSILEEIILADSRVAREPKPVIAVKELADSSVNLTARPFINVNDQPAVTFAITEQVKLRFDQEGISIPFPQRDVHVFQAPASAHSGAEL